MKQICYKLCNSSNLPGNYVFIKSHEIDILRTEYVKFFGYSISEKSIQYDIKMTTQYGCVEIFTINWTYIIEAVYKKIKLINEVNTSIEKVLV